MRSRAPIVLSWSGGKDSALALHALRSGGRYEVVSLLTTVAAAYDRVSHHGVRVELVERQAAALGVPLRKVILAPDACTMEHYETRMEEALLEYKAAGVYGVASGDIFLRPLRAYRERILGELGMEALFPIWGRDTGELMRTFLALGFRGCIACVDGRKLSAAFAGRAIGHDLLAELPAGVDPCGEHGEFHTFVYDGPIFRYPVHITVGEVVRRDVRYFADLLPREAGDAPPAAAGGAP